MYSKTTIAACICVAFIVSGCDESGGAILGEPAVGAANAALPSGLTTWQPSQFYPAGRVVQRDDKMFVSVVDTQSSVPITESDDWVLATGIAQSDQSAPIVGTGFGLIWRGEWVVGQAYEAGEVVSYDGQSFVSVTASTGVESPDDTAFWDLLARRGDAGAAGFDGLTGPQGDAGPVGPTGTKGEDGESGAQGLPGLIGPTGARGEAGATGAVGATGETGAQGVQGVAGAKGDTGDIGAAGIQGVQGARGVKGDTGDTGAAGAIGLQGVPGVTGAQGGKGDTGDTGAAGATGSQGVQGVAGVQGDKGDTGIAGAAGEQGIQGVVGDKGDTGNTGPAGIQGIAGVKGDTGDAGAAGVQGIAGVKGDTGDAGAAGVQGIAGVKGDTGDAGPAGAVGLVWEGSWSILGGYVAGEGVSYNGSSYIATQDTPAGTVPTDTAYWNVLAAAGLDGSSGSGGGGTGSNTAHYKVAGITSAIFAGNSGSRALNAACKAQFGATARMANSLEAALYPPLAAVSGMGWVQGISHPSDVGIDNTSGLDLGSSTLTCNGWSSSSGNGMVIFGQNFAFNQYGSCANSQGVICAIEDGVEQEYEFAGFTTTSMSGNGGYLNMANACRADVGSTARVATTAEVARSNLDVTYSGKAWVQGSAHAANPDTDRVSGVSVGVGDNLTCSGWSNSGSHEGLVVDGSSYSISAQACYIQTPVACSAPK